MFESRQIVAAGCAGVLSIALVQAQVPATSAPEAAQPASSAREPVRLTESTDPASLPGDFMDIPQTAQLKVPLGTPAVTHNTRPLPTDATPSPGYALALEAAQVAMASCEADGYRVAVAVTDAAGKLKVALAPDGVANNRVYMALRPDRGGSVPHGAGQTQHGVAAGWHADHERRGSCRSDRCERRDGLRRREMRAGWH
jgi:hypothetical protein